MSERNFRIVLGAWLIMGLFLNSPHVMYALVALLVFEGITNLRLPRLITSARVGRQASTIDAAAHDNPDARTSFEAERGFRLIIALLVLVPVVGSTELLWLLPWFVGFALIAAGLSGICPIVLTLRWLGMR